MSGQLRFALRRKCLTIQEYVLISQFQPFVEVYRRCNGADWMLQTYVGLDAVANFDSVGCSIPLSEIYLGVKFGR